MVSMAFAHLVFAMHKWGNVGVFSTEYAPARQKEIYEAAKMFVKAYEQEHLKKGKAIELPAETKGEDNET